MEVDDVPHTERRHTTVQQVVREETRRMARGLLPLLCIAFGVFTLLGYGGYLTALSLLAGATFSLLLFRLICQSASRAVLFPPAQGMKTVRKGYAFRYMLTALFLVIVLKAPIFQPVAAIIPLFFPRIILLLGSILNRKGGK